MHLVKKLASRTSTQHSNTEIERRETQETTRTRSHQNAENLNLLDVHWNNSKQIMCLDEKTVTPTEKCKILVYHLNEVIEILTDEREDYHPGPCLKYVLDEEIFQILYLWSTELTGSVRDVIMRTEQMRIYRNLIDRCKGPLLLYEQIWKPLLFLLYSCKTYGVTPDMEEDFVAVLKSLCVCVNRDVALLDLFFLDNHSESEIGTLSVFPLLISYLHRDGDVGVWARDAVLLCMALSSVDHRLGNYIIEKTNFCPVLATGLSALFSDLPTSLDIPSEDWYSLERGLWATFPELVAFLTSLEFCNNVIQIAHPKVQTMLLELIYNGFLVSVMSSALSQSSVEALTAVTAYIDLFLRSITDSQLMSVFVKFILTERCDGVPILEYLVSRISQETQLSVVSLGLFYTLLDLNCEDIMYTLVLKYLIPCSHILSSQKRTVREVDFYSKSAVKFLSLIPSCCDLYHQTSKPTSLSSSSESLNKSSGGQVKIDLETSHDLVLYRPHLTNTRYTEVQSDYMEYLTDARSAIRYCAKRCACWSSSYDGADPSSANSPDEEKRRSLSQFNGSIASRRTSEPYHSLSGTESKKPRSASDFDTHNAETCLGPFLNTVIKKLENMHNNTFYVNLILTAVITRLSYYPQPLLKSFLLNYNMVLKPGVRSLFQILSSMKIKVENVVENVDGLEKLLRRARKNLVLREEKSKASIQTAFIEPQKPIKEHKKVTISDVIPRSPKHFHRSKAESSLLSVVKLLKDGPAPSLNKSFSCGSIDTNSSSSSLSLTESIETPESMSPQYGSTGDLSDSASPRVMSPVVSLKFGLKWKHSNEEAKNTFKRKNPKTIKNAVYCVIVLEEWLKELAAISQEHALWQMEDYEMTT